MKKKITNSIIKIIQTVNNRKGKSWGEKMEHLPKYKAGDVVDKMYREYRDYIESLGEEDKFDTCYKQLRLPREYFVRMCRMLELIAGIAHKLHLLAYEEEGAEGYGKLEVVYKVFAEFMGWDEKRHVRVLIDYDPEAMRVNLLRCPVNRDEEEQTPQTEE